MSAGSIEIDFPGGYPAGMRVDVTVVAFKLGAPIGTATGAVQALAPGCGTLAVTVGAGAIDAGAGGNGAAGQMGSGGTAAAWAEGASGAFCIWARMTSMGVGASNTNLPVKSQYATHPTP